MIDRKTCTLALTLALGAAGAAQAQVIGDQPWTTVGAAGTVSSVDTSDVAYFVGGWVGLSAGATSATIRYNVVAVDGLLATSGPLPTRTLMRVKYLDPGETSRVVITLKEFDLNNSSGAAANRMYFDSNDYAGSGTFQTRDILCEAAAFDFDFVNKGYFLEVQLTRPAGGSNPGLGMVQLGRTTQGCIAG
jgi:hypothetical protein